MNKLKWKNILTKEFLTTEYVDKNLSINQIAKNVGCDPKSVYDYINNHYIEMRIYNHPKLQNSKRWKGYGEIPQTYFANIRNGAKTRNLIFDITIEYIWDLFIKQNRKCALSGKEIGFQSANVNTASLDRINSKIGYIKENVQWVHRDINFCKQSFSNEEFINLCLDIVKHNNKI